MELGDTYYATKKYAKAIDSYKKALKLGDENERAYLKLGNLYYDTNKPLKAIGTYQRVLKLNPQLNDIRVDLATMYRKSGKLDKAIEELRKINEADPNNATAYFNLGIILHNDKKDLAGTKASWEKFLVLTPNSPDVEQVKKLLDTIDKELANKNSTSSKKPS